MGFLDGKRALIVGVASPRSIAWGIAEAMHEQGAELAFTYQNDKLKPRVEKIAEATGADIVLPCDVACDDEIDRVFAELKRYFEHSCSSASAALTSAWQSSNAPLTDRDSTLSPQQVSWCSCRAETRPAGNSTTTRMPGRPLKAAATAPPVSPDVATKMVNGAASSPSRRVRHAARKPAPTSLNAAVGP